MPEEGMHWLKRDQILSFEEIARYVRIVSRLGIRKIRLTGGEPLLRKELHLLVSGLREIAEIEDIALTTNGYYLADQIDDLAAAGLHRVNVSLDSSDPKVFQELTRRDHLDRVWKGIDAAVRLGLVPVKLNVVLIRGVNDREIEELARLARSGPFVVRFIEFMPIGAEDAWAPDRVVHSREVIDRISALGIPLLPVNHRESQASADYRFEDGVGEIGCIASVSDPFCTACNRIRLTSDGKLRTCLFSLHETDIKTLMRSGCSDDDIAADTVRAVWEKEQGHLIGQTGFERPTRTMHQIGG